MNPYCLLCFQLFASFLIAGVSVGRAQTADSFGPVVNNTVYVIAMQTDGSLIAGGTFTSIGGVARSPARLNPDAFTDVSFNQGPLSLPHVPSTPVYCLQIQPDGKILIGGGFTNVSTYPRSCIARLDADGSLDACGPNARCEADCRKRTPTGTAFLVLHFPEIWL